MRRHDQKSLHRTFLLTATVAFAASLGLRAAVQEKVEQPKAQQPSGTTVRGCLTGSKLTHVEPSDPGAPYPESLGVSGIRAIRSQLKALNGHQVELIGTVEGVGPQAGGILVAESDKGKVYLGGGDPSLGEDFRRRVPPTFYAHTVRDVAPACTAASGK